MGTKENVRRASGRCGHRAVPMHGSGRTGRKQMWIGTQVPALRRGSIRTGSPPNGASSGAGMLRTVGFLLRGRPFGVGRSERSAAYCWLTRLRELAAMPKLNEYRTVGQAAKHLKSWDRAGKLAVACHPLAGFRVYLKKELDALLYRLRKATKSEGRPLTTLSTRSSCK